jgi:hypothetical protein
VLGVEGTANWSLKPVRVVDSTGTTPAMRGDSGGGGAGMVELRASQRSCQRWVTCLSEVLQGIS